MKGNGTTCFCAGLTVDECRKAGPEAAKVEKVTALFFAVRLKFGFLLSRAHTTIYLILRR
jgi:hypothetical protein